MKLIKKPLLVLSAAALLSLAACGNTDKTENTSGKQLSGDILIDGSSTVAPIMEAVSEEYTAAQPDVHASVGISGTGGGFEKFTKGETDLSNASRPIKDEEAAIAKENNIDYIQLELAYDGLSVVVSKENDFVDKLTVEELMEVISVYKNKRLIDIYIHGLRSKIEELPNFPKYIRTIKGKGYRFEPVYSQ